MNFRYKHYMLLFVLLLSLTLGLVSCGPESAHSRWLQGIPCKPPCWEGLTPGVTLPQEGLEILKKNARFKNVRLYNGSPNLGSLTWEGTEGNVSGDAFYNPQVPDQPIYVIRPNLPAIKFSEIIKAYGEPSHLVAGKSVLRLEKGLDHYYLSVIYLPQGFGFAIDIDGNPPVISPDLTLKQLRFFKPTLDGLKAAGDIVSEIVPWQGFKDFDFYCKQKSNYC